MIKGIAHVCFTASDLDASLAFYRDALGMDHAFDFVDERGRRTGVYLRAGGRTFIELFEGEVAAGAEGQPPQAYRHFCLEVDDIQAAVAALRSRGVEVTEPKLGTDQSWQAWLADPDGNRIELHQYTPDSRQTPWLG